MLKSLHWHPLWYMQIYFINLFKGLPFCVFFSTFDFQTEPSAAWPFFFQYLPNVQWKNYFSTQPNYRNLLISENLDLLFIMLLCIVVKEQYPGSRLIFRSYIFLFELNLQNFLQTYEIKSFVNTFDQTKVFEHHKINIFINFYR